MYKNINKNLTIDLIAKDLRGSSHSNKLESIKKIHIFTTLDYKNTSIKYIKQYIKRDHYKLMKLFGQRPAFILSKKSVAEWRLRKDSIIGSEITFRGVRNIERIYKLWLFSSQTRDNQRNFLNQYGQRGISSEGIEWFILVNDWPMSDIISSNQNLKNITINDELRELKLKELGMYLDIKLKNSDYLNSFKFSYYLFLSKKS